MPYHAFMSYSHAADGKLAPALHSALHQFAKPWYRLRALHIFRDKTTLHPTPHLWGSIQTALDQSSYFILLASPDAAASMWVKREIEYWLARSSPDRILIVLTDGDLVWDDALGAFDARASTAISDSLTRVFREEPLYLDLRWAREPVQLSLREPRFREAVAEIAAPLHGRPKDEISGEDVRQHRRARQLAWAGAVALSILTVASVLAAWSAIQQRNVATAQSRVALARLLAAQANSVRTQFPDRLPLAALLAVQSTRLRPSFEGNEALRAALTLLPQQAHSFPYEGPEGRVRALAFTSDGTFLAVARDAGGADLFHLRERTALGTFFPDDSPVRLVEVGAEDAKPGKSLGRSETTSLAFSPDGRALAIASNDGAARIFDKSSARELLRINHRSPVSTLAFDPIGRHLATGSKDGKVRIFALKSGSVLSGIEQATSDDEVELVMESAHDEEVRQVRFSPDGNILAALSTDGGISLSQVKTKKVSRAWYRGASGLGLAFSADGQKLASANGNFAFVWDVSTGKQLFKAMHARSEKDALNHLEWIDTAVLSPNGDYLATGGRDGSARVWNLATGQEVVRLAHGARVETVAFVGDGTTLSTASFDGTARLWELPSGRERLRAVHPGGSEVVTVSPDGAQVASGGSDGSVQVWMLGRPDQLASVHHLAEVRAVGISPDGLKMVSGDERGGFRVWSASGRVELELERIYGPRTLVFSEDGHFIAGEARNPYLFAVDLAKSHTPAPLATFRDSADHVLRPRHIVTKSRDAGRVRIWKTAGGAELTPIEAPKLAGLQLDPTGQFVAILESNEPGKGASLRVRDLATGREVGKVSLGSVRDELFALSRDGNLVAVGVREVDEKLRHARNFLEVWDVLATKRVQRIPHDDVIVMARFDPSGALVLTIEGNSPGQRRQIRVWDGASGALRAQLSHEEEIDTVRMSSEGSILGTLSAGRVSIWNYSTGELLSQIADASYIRTLQLSRDGRYVLTGAADGIAALWIWKTEDLQAEACKRLARNLTQAEWRQYVGVLPYQRTCANLPADTQASAP